MSGGERSEPNRAPQEVKAFLWATASKASLKGLPKSPKTFWEEEETSDRAKLFRKEKRSGERSLRRRMFEK